MVKRALLTKKLASYSVLATAVLAIDNTVDAQIVYTKVNDTICPNNSYNLDLNGDGITDFNIVAYSGTARACITYGWNRSVRFSPEGSGGGLAVDRKTLEPIVFNSQQPIDHHYPLSSEIRGTLINRDDVYGQGFGGISQGGPFDTTDHNKFVGLWIKLNKSFYYGWARITILNHPGNHNFNGYCAVLTDYAFNTQPNTPILAGEENANENNNLTVFPNPVYNGSQLDISCYLNYEEPVSISLYNILGKQVNSITIQQSTLALNTFKMPINNLPAGIYMVKIYCNEFTATKEIVINK